MTEAKGPPGKPNYVVLTLWLPGLLPMFAQMFGASFLPSTDWVSKTTIVGLTIGLVLAMLSLWFVTTAEGWDSNSDMKKFSTVLGTLVIGFLSGRNVVVITGPMAIALIGGHQVELPYVVERADITSSKRCHESAELQGLPLLFDRVCGLPSAFRDSLTPGARIVVAGRGTSLGVYAERLRRVE